MKIAIGFLAGTLLLTGIFLSYTSVAQYNSNRSIHIEPPLDDSTSYQHAPDISDPKPVKSSSNKIQLALLLDTSNSMDGMIEQAKSQLWKMVNKLANKKKDGEHPDLEIALYEYGNDNLDAGEGYVRLVSPFTTDMDLISEKLFSLTTNGGSEYCGWVIKDAIEDLKWSDEDALKIINIAGNENFDQGRHDYRTSCKTALNKDIRVNTIFCGNYREGINISWKSGADIAEGAYMNIDTDQEVVHVPTPYDSEIINLNLQLNGTYIGYGQQGAVRKKRMEEQDNKAKTYSWSNSAERATFKAKSNYKNTDWDIVDAYEEDDEVLEKEEVVQSLPESIQKLSAPKRVEYVENMKAQRDSIKTKILELEKKRNAFVANSASETTETMDQQLIKHIETQANEVGYY